MKDIIADFPVIYHNVLKHEWHLSFAWLPWVCNLIARFSACWFASSALSHNIPLLIAIYGIDSHHLLLYLT